MASAARLFTDFVEEEPELNPVKYESFATNSAIQLSTVLDKVQTLLSQYRQIDLPVLTSRLTYNPWFKETARALVEFVRMQEKP